MKKTCYIIQARLNSQRVPQKMIRPIAGTTLLDIAFQKVIASSIPNEDFYFCANEDELLMVAENYNLNTFERSYRSANSENSLQEIYEWHERLSKEYDYVVLINACLPFLKVQTINRFVKEFNESSSEGMFGVIPKKQYYWDSKGNMINEWGDSKIMNTKECSITYEAGHGLYASNIHFIKDGFFMDDKIPPSPDLFIMDEEECFDIDYEWQFNRAELILKSTLLAT